MDGEIIDIQDEENMNTNYSRLSFLFSILNLIPVAYLFTSIPSKIEASQTIQKPSLIKYAMVQMFCAIGVDPAPYNSDNRLRRLKK